MCEKLHAGKDDCFYYRPMQYPKYRFLFLIIYQTLKFWMFYFSQLSQIRLKNDPGNSKGLPPELVWKDGKVFTG